MAEGGIWWINRIVDLLTWLQCPFRRGRRYRVREPFVAFNQRFEAGEILVFESHHDAIKDCVTEFNFKDASGNPRTFYVDLEMPQKRRLELVTRWFKRA